MKGFLLPAIVVIVHLHGSFATLVVQGPATPVLEGDTVTLECLISDSELNTSQVHFERLSKYMNEWYRLEPEKNFHRYLSRCFGGYNVEVSRADGRLLLIIANIQSFYHGPYRCVADNATAADMASEPLHLAVHYMRELTVYREGFSRYFTSSLQELRVPLGGDVEVECAVSASEAPTYFWRKEGAEWILPSSKLSLKKVCAEDGGAFTCVASHPSVTSLTKSLTISITVLPVDAPWYESTNGRLVLMTSAVGVAMLVLILAMSVFLCRRAKQSNRSKRPIDDHSQKKPIYKTSVESLPSASGDEQPLV